jgi:GNAT superfamily N-acetyltransferase
VGRAVKIVEHRRGEHTISTDPAKLDLDAIYGYLSGESYWAQGRPLDVMSRAVEHSLCFGLYAGDEQVGLARVVTDYATFAWLCDVFVLEPHRGQGLGKWLIESVVTHPDLQGLLFLLATRDAHGLYQRYGDFEPMRVSERWMLRPKLVAKREATGGRGE